MGRTDVIPQNVPQHVQRRKSDSVGLSQGRNIASFDRKRCSPVPEIGRAGRGDAVALAAPERVVQLDRDGQIWIEIVSGPLPRGRFYERAAMVGGQIRGSVRTIAGFFEGGSCVG